MQAWRRDKFKQASKPGGCCIAVPEEIVAVAAVYGLFRRFIRCSEHVTHTKIMKLSHTMAYLSFVCQEQQSHFITSFSPEHFYLEKEHECGAKDGVQ